MPRNSTMDRAEVKNSEKERRAGESIPADVDCSSRSDKTQSGEVDNPKNKSKEADNDEEEGELLLTSCGRATWRRLPREKLCPELIKEIWRISAM